MTADLKMRMVLETDKAEEQALAAAKRIGQDIAAATKQHAVEQVNVIKRATENSQGSVNKLRGAWEKVARATRFAADAVIAIRGGVDLARNTLEGFTQALQFVDVQNVLARAGLDAGSIQRVSMALGNTVSQLQLAANIKLASDASLTANEIVKAAQAASYLAKQTGQSKAEMFQLVTSGELTAAQLDKIGLSAIKLEGAILKAGDGMTSLDQQAIKVREIIRAAAGASGNFTANTNQTQDAMARAVAQFQNLSLELKKNALPLLNRVLKVVNKLVEDPKLMADTIVGFIRMVGNFLARLPEMILKAIEGIKILGVSVGKSIADGARNGLRTIKQDAAALFDGLKDQAKKFMERFDPGDQLVSIDAITSANKKTNKEIQRGNELLRRRSNARQQAANEAQQELQARRAEARALVRGLNDEFNSLDLISNLGGPISGVISALKEGVEKAAIFRAQFGPEVVRNAADFSVNLDKAAFATEGARKAAKQLRLALEGGKIDLREYIGNEKSVNDQLRAGLSTLASQQKILAAQVELRNQDKDVTAAKVTLQRTIAALSKRDSAVNRNIVTMLQKALVTYKQIGAERRALLMAQIASAKVEKQSELAQKALESKKRIVEAQRQVADLGKALAQARGIMGNPADDIRADASRRMQDVALVIQDLSRQAKELQDKLGIKGAFGGDQAARQEAIDRLAALREEVSLRQASLQLIAQQRDALIENQSVIGSMVKVMREQASGLTVKLGQRLASSVTELAQGLVGSLGNVFSALTSTPTTGLKDFGQAVLDTFANMAFALSSFFAAQGIGFLFTPGGQGQGVALLAAAAGMAAVGGLIKAGSAAISKPSKPSTSSGGGSSANPTRQGLPGAQPREREQSTTYVLVTNSIFGSEEQQARHLKNFVKRNKRALGGQSI